MCSTDIVTKITSQDVLDLVDDQERAVQRAVLAAIEQARSQSDLQELADEIESGAFQERLEQQAQIQAVLIADAVVAAYAAGVTLGRQLVQDETGVTIFINQADFSYVSDIDEINRGVINSVTTQQRRAVDSALAAERRRQGRAVDDPFDLRPAPAGFDREGLARAYAASIGMNERDQRAVDNYRAALEEGSARALRSSLRDKRSDVRIRRAREDPLTQAQIDRLVTGYARRLRLSRSRGIAQSTVTRVIHQGMVQSLEQAISQGAISSYESTWNTRQDERVRNSHRPLEGQQRDQGDTFIEGISLRFPGDPAAPLDETSGCRCWLTFRVIR